MTRRLCSNCGEELNAHNSMLDAGLFRHRDEHDCIKVLKNGYHRCIAELSQTRLELQAANESLRLFVEKPADEIKLSSDNSVATTIRHDHIEYWLPSATTVIPPWERK